tara:strand:- start:1 stop:156 length:156 start_codon:yes stop_codon:yes gene_type:complete
MTKIVWILIVSKMSKKEKIMGFKPVNTKEKRLGSDSATPTKKPLQMKRFFI